jgi:hypothetical protein
MVTNALCLLAAQVPCLDLWQHNARYFILTYSWPSPRPAAGAPQAEPGAGAPLRATEAAAGSGSVGTGTIAAASGNGAEPAGGGLIPDGTPLYPGEAEDAECARLVEAHAPEMFHASVGEVVQLLQQMMRGLVETQGGAGTAAAGNGAGPRAVGPHGSITFPVPQMPAQQPLQWQNMPGR